MSTKSQRPEGQEGALSMLNAAIDALNLAKEASSITPAEVAFDSTSVLLAVVRDIMINEVDYVELGLACAEVCEVLDRGTNGRGIDQLNQSVLMGIEQLTMTVTEIQRNIIGRGKLNPISRLFRKKHDNETIATWRLDLNGVLRLFNTELGINKHVTVATIRHDVANAHTIVPGIHPNTLNADVIVPDVRHHVSSTHAAVSDIYRKTSRSREDMGNMNPATHASAPGDLPPPPPRSMHEIVPDIRHDIVKAGAIISDVHRTVIDTHTMVYNMLKSQEGTGGQNRSTQNGACGELPPPPPRIFFGRDKLIEEIVDFAERLMPIALTGAGGIGKTSTALTVLHDDRIKRRFGEDRRFIRCDKFPASLHHFLRRLSKVTGAGIENPEDLTPLRPHLSSKDVLIVLDNAEYILDPRGTGAQEIYAVVEELSQMSNICLCITSRISTLPPDCEWLDIPTLSKEAACDTFYRIYKHGERSDVVTNILEQLDFHPLSITLLATVAYHNRWDVDQLAREWEEHRTDILQTEHNKSLAATIELSLSSLMFQELGPNARDLLGVVAFFPQGVYRKNIDWLFPTIVGRKNMFDKFCVLSLTYRNDDFITMLAPIRDHLSPKDPMSTPLLCSTKEHYFDRLSVDIEPGSPGFEGARWIRSEDMNVEHLVDVFTTVDATSGRVWGACADFLKHLVQHKPRLTTLGSKIEALPDDHPSKSECLFQLSRSFQSVGNHAERKRLLTHTLKLSRERKDDHQLARTLRHLSRVHSFIGSYEEGIRQAEEASEISEKLGDTVEQARCLIDLAWLLQSDGQLNAAEEAISRGSDLLGRGQQHLVCDCHQALDNIYCTKDETRKAIHLFEAALGLASYFNWLGPLFWIHFYLAGLLSSQSRFDDAHTHVEQAKSCAITNNNTYLLAVAMRLQTQFWHRQHRFEEAKSEALRAVGMFQKVGVADYVDEIREFLRQIDRDAEMGNRVNPSEPGDDDRSTESK